MSNLEFYMSGTTDAKERVDRGAALLDAQVPGWWRNIDTDVLLMSSGSRCVLGQVFHNKAGKRKKFFGSERWLNGYDYASTRYDMRQAQVGAYYGFERDCRTLYQVNMGIKGDYRALREQWIVAINDRLLLDERPEVKTDSSELVAA